MLTWRNHPDVRCYMITQHEISFEEHQKWFQAADQDDSRRLLIVEDVFSPIGFVQFTNVSVGGISDWGFFAKPGAPKGSGQKLGKVALEYAFQELKLHKVCGQTLAFNVKSIEFHLRLGFQQEGLLRDQYRIHGEYHHLINFGLLRNDWDSRSIIVGEK